jgi:hypothetical protein
MADMTMEQRKKATPLTMALKFWKAYRLAIQHKIDLGFDIEAFEKIIDRPEYHVLSNEIEYVGTVTDEERLSIILGFWITFGESAMYERYYLGFDFNAFDSILPEPTKSHCAPLPPTASSCHRQGNNTHCRFQSKKRQSAGCIRNRCAHRCDKGQ